MTDREPLRVGPLVLRWDENRGQFIDDRPGIALGSVVYQMHTGEWVWRIGGIYSDSPALYSATEAAEDMATDLRSIGLFAQYRSRRRLLARECERRAKDRTARAWQCDEMVTDDDSGSMSSERYMAALRRRDWLRAQAAKYAQWAERLRNG